MAGQQSNTARTGHCRSCRYPLIGLDQHRCPECGRTFDPDDPKTMYYLGAPGWLARHFLRPPGRLLEIATAIASLLMLYALTAPRICIIAILLFIPLLLGCALLWVMHLMIAAIVRLVRKDSLSGLAKQWRRYLVVPAIIALILLLGWLDIPDRLRFKLSQSAMDRLAQQVMADPNTAYPDQWVGLYYAQDIEALPNGVRFLISDGCGWDVLGFAYGRDGEPMVVGDEDDDYYEEYNGDWYLWMYYW